MGLVGNCGRGPLEGERLEDGREEVDGGVDGEEFEGRAEGGGPDADFFDLHLGEDEGKGGGGAVGGGAVGQD